MKRQHICRSSGPGFARIGGRQGGRRRWTSPGAAARAAADVWGGRDRRRGRSGREAPCRARVRGPGDGPRAVRTLFAAVRGIPHGGGRSRRRGLPGRAVGTRGALHAVRTRIAHRGRPLDDPTPSSSVPGAPRPADSLNRAPEGRRRPHTSSPVLGGSRGRGAWSCWGREVFRPGWWRRSRRWRTCGRSAMTDRAGLRWGGGANSRRGSRGGGTRRSSDGDVR